MRISIVILLLFALSRLEAQSYAEEYYQFDCAYKTMLGYYNRGLYHEAIFYTDSLEGNRYVTPTINYFVARVYSLSNDFDKTLHYLEKAVKGGVTKNQIEKMYDLDGFRASNLSIVYEINYDKWHQFYLDHNSSAELDSTYLKMLKEIRVWKSNNRSKTWYNQDGDIIYAEDSTFVKPSKEQEDSVFYYTLDLIITKGVPTLKNVGTEFYWFSRNLGYSLSDDFSLTDKRWLALKNMIDDQIDKGCLKPFYYATILDNIRDSRKKALYYGINTAIYSNSFNIGDKVEFENPEELNIRRRSVGLCPIQLELWSRAIELPNSLKEVVFK